MTRSTESESVSIARYDFQNVRRESLLLQNRTAPEEEDTNASSNTEEENTNALFFNHEIIKISINTELNAWISTHEADDIVVFIKYMCQQHDIEIEIHNDMIQMLEDVNEANITLKITQTIDWSSDRVSGWHFEFDSIRSRVVHIFNSIWVELLIFSTWRDSTRLRIESTRPDSPRIRAWRQES